jgi:glucose-1-phosphate thymidylyltransferase
VIVPTCTFLRCPTPPHDGLIEHVERVLLDGATNRTSGHDAILTGGILDNGVGRHYADALGGWRDGPHDLAELRSLRAPIGGCAATGRSADPPPFGPEPSQKVQGRAASTSRMDATTGVVLAAGEGTRLRPLTRNRPKPMLPAADRPILEYVLDALVDAGVEELVLVVGYKRDRVQNQFGPTYRNRPVDYVVQEKQLGSGHALLQASEAVDGPMVVVNGDRIVEASMVAAVRDAHDDDAAATVGVLEGPDPSQYGAVSMDGDRVTALVERPTGEEYHRINAGIYAFDPDIFAALSTTPRRTGELPLTDTVSRLIGGAGAGGVRGVVVEGLWADATYPWDLLTVARELLADGRVDGIQRHPGVWVDDSASVEHATLRGPVVVGPDCELGPGAVIGPNVALGRNVTVGANAVVEGSVLDADTRVGAGSTVADCVTGQTVRLGSGTVAPGGPADVVVDERVFRDERLGAVLADRARAAGGVRLAPGTLVGPNARLATGVVVEGRIPAGAEVVR